MFRVDRAKGHARAAIACAGALVRKLDAAVSELGVYSTLLTGEGGQVLRNQPAGHLVRTKLEGVDEGGVAAGFAVLSSPLAARDTC